MQNGVPHTIVGLMSGSESIVKFGLFFPSSFLFLLLSSDDDLVESFLCYGWRVLEVGSFECGADDVCKYAA